MSLQQKSLQTKSCYEQLRRQLIHGQLSPGSRLVEEKWAANLGVNRSALREALAVLAHDGLLEVGARGGFFVPLFDQAVLDEVLEVRLALETGALQILETRNEFPVEGLRLLHEACDLMQRLMEAGFEYGFAEADRNFHETLVRCADNSRLLRVYSQAPLPLFPFPEISAASRQANMQKSLADHRELCKLLEAKQFPEARAYLRRHLLVNHRRAASWLDAGVTNHKSAKETAAE